MALLLSSSALPLGRVARCRAGSGSSSSRLVVLAPSSRRARSSTRARAAPAPVPDVVCEEVMNAHPVLLKTSMTMKEAAHKMLDANVSGAPVVDDGGRLAGVLSESDIIWKGAGAPEDHFIIPPVYIGIVDAFVSLRENKKVEAEVGKILAKTVGDAMVGREKVVSARLDTPLSDAARKLLHHDINLLPIVDEAAGGKVVGVVTRHDVLRGIYASNNPML